jgi:hypothetical protein
MRSTEIRQWSTSLGVDPAEAHAELRTLWRSQEDLYANQMRIRDRLHSAPDPDLDESLRQVEGLLGRICLILGDTVAQLAGSVR